MKLLESGEMYLETILILSKKNEFVRSLDEAEYMNFSKPSVSRAMGILKDNKYIAIDENGHITLLKKGSDLANKIYERHVILTECLAAIGVEKKIAEEDACKIEHDISDQTFAALKKHLYKHKEAK